MSTPNQSNGNGNATAAGGNGNNNEDGTQVAAAAMALLLQQQPQQPQEDHTADSVHSTLNALLRERIQQEEQRQAQLRELTALALIRQVQREEAQKAEQRRQQHNAILQQLVQQVVAGSATDSSFAVGSSAQASSSSSDPISVLLLQEALAQRTTGTTGTGTLNLEAILSATRPVDSADASGLLPATSASTSTGPAASGSSSIVPPSSTTNAATSTFTSSPSSAAAATYGKGRRVEFPQKLYQMLQDLEAQGQTHIASFTPDGTAFCIHDKDLFQEHVLHRYFSTMKSHSSFQRQLNLYDFVRIVNGPHRGCYAHKKFIRGKPHLCTNMKRTKTKGKLAHTRRQTHTTVSASSAASASGQA